MNRVCDNVGNCINAQATDANTNGQVSLLQNFLKKEGYIPGNTPLNGNFGITTKKALQSYQVDNGITRSGETGPNTRAVIVEDMGDGGDVDPLVSSSVYTETVNNVRVYDAGMQTAKTPAFGSEKVFSSDKLGDFAKQKLDEQAKREANYQTGKDLGSVMNTPEPAHPADNNYSNEARNAGTDNYSNEGNNNQTTSWGREDRSNSVVTTQSSANFDNHILPKWVRDVLGIGGQDPSIVPVEDRGFSESTNSDYGRDSAREVSLPKDPLEEANKGVNHDLPNPNYSNEGNHTDPGSVMNTPEPAHPADNNYSNEARNAGTDNYSNEGNHADPGSVMNTPEPAHPADSNYSNEGNNNQTTSWGREDRSNSSENYSNSESRYQERGRDGGINSNESSFDDGRGEGSYGSGGGGCFVAGTKILMSDMSFKNIENVKIGDKVKTPEGFSLVEDSMFFEYSGDIYAYNHSGNYFFTPNHPFMTTSGWKSFDPTRSMKESSGISVSTTTIGDTLVKMHAPEKIKSIQKKHSRGLVYNITVSGSHVYFANGYLVHNKVSEDSSAGFWDYFW